MEATLQALGQILLRAVPTFLLVIFLNFYLKNIFFKPLRNVLRQRYEASEGDRKLAEQSLERAAAKAADVAVARAKADLAKDVEVAKDGLARESEILAQQVAELILRRSAA